MFFKENYVIKKENTHFIESKNLSFFHSVAFCKRLKNRSLVFYNLYDGRIPVISIAFEEFHNQAISLTKSPYGGFIFDKIPTYEVIYWFIQTITKLLSHHSQIIINQPVQWKDRNSILINKALISNGFDKFYTEINQHIDVNSSSFYTIINRNRKRKLTDCKNQDFFFSELDASQLAIVYPLVVECRENKGYPITMSLGELQKAFEQFPDQYKLFGVWNKKELIATAVSVVVNSDVLYNFYHGDLLSYRQHSPVTLLVEGIYLYCQRHQFSILDLGISSHLGKLNDGLFAFKKSLGAIECPKIAYQR